MTFLTASTTTKRIAKQALIKTNRACWRQRQYLCFSSSPPSSSSPIQNLLRELRRLDTSCLCDADKTVNGTGGGIRVMNDTLRPMNRAAGSASMAGVALTVAFTEPDDFLPVLRALSLEAERDDVLVVDTMSSTRAVAGEIFLAEARRKQLSGMVIDGPVRDIAHYDSVVDGNDETTMRLYATGVTPYSGTTQSPGNLRTSVRCGGIEVHPGDVVVGDDDGIVVGCADEFWKLLPVARTIQDAEAQLLEGIQNSPMRTLESMTNVEEHLRRRLKGEPSDLEFRI